MRMASCWTTRCDSSSTAGSVPACRVRAPRELPLSSADATSRSRYTRRRPLPSMRSRPQPVSDCWGPVSWPLRCVVRWRSLPLSVRRRRRPPSRVRGTGFVTFSLCRCRSSVPLSSSLPLVRGLSSSCSTRGLHPRAPCWPLSDACSHPSLWQCSLIGFLHRSNPCWARGVS